MLIEIKVGNLGLTLRKAREAAGTSLAVVAEQAGMDFDNLNRIETEQDLRVPLPVLIKVAEVVNVDLAEAVGGWVELVVTTSTTS